MTKIAVVRVRGIRKMEPKIAHTLELLRLSSPNHCVILEDGPSARGMLQVVKDYVAFGPLQEKTFFHLLYKRGELGGKNLDQLHKEEEIQKLAQKLFRQPQLEGVDPVFRLRPPRKGYKNVKRTYPRGALGARPEMDSLVSRMV